MRLFVIFFFFGCAYFFGLFEKITTAARTARTAQCESKVVFCILKNKFDHELNLFVEFLFLNYAFA